MSDREGEVLYDIPYMQNLKQNDTNELTQQKNTHRQKNELMVVRENDSQGLWDSHVHTAVFKMDNQQRPIVEHMELCSMLCASLDGKRV